MNQEPVYIIRIIKNKFVYNFEDKDEELESNIKTQPGSYKFGIEILKKIKNGGNCDEHGQKFFSDILPYINETVKSC